MFRVSPRSIRKAVCAEIRFSPIFFVSQASLPEAPGTGALDPPGFRPVLGKFFQNRFEPCAVCAFYQERRLIGEPPLPAADVSDGSGFSGNPLEGVFKFRQLAVCPIWTPSRREQRCLGLQVLFAAANFPAGANYRFYLK